MPGTYATRDGVRVYLTSTITAEDTEIDAALEDAAIEVDAAVGPDYPASETGGWKFPDLDDTPRLITLVTTWLSVSIILGLKQIPAKDSRQIPDEQKFRNRAEARLKQIREGVLSLADPEAETESDSDGALAVSGPQEIFTETVMDKFSKRGSDGSL